MARNKDKLTRFISSKTVVTDEYLNSMYGGLYGTEEESKYTSVDPLVAGHVHDGAGGDGHAQKINLSDHVTGSLDVKHLSGTVALSGSIDLAIQVKNSLDISRLSIDGDGEFLYAGSIKKAPTFKFVESGNHLQISRSNHLYFGTHDVSTSGYITAGS